MKRKFRIGFVHLAANMVRVPPIGLVLLTDMVQKKFSDVEIKIIDNTFEDVYKETLKFKPDMLCVTSVTEDYKRAIDYSKSMKKIFNIPIIIGGVHISTLPTSFNKVFDVGIIKEGWINLIQLVDLYKKESNFSPEELNKIKGLIYSKDNKIVMTKPSKQLKNLENIPIMNYDLINKGYFKKHPILEKQSYGISMAILTSIGCPYNCRFCSSKAFWQTIRYFPVDYVVKNIKILVKKYHINHIDIFDDLFFLNKDRLKHIYEGLKKEKLINKFTFSCQGRVDVIDDERCKLLKKMNCVTISFGFESGSNKVIKYMKRDSVTVEDNKKAIMMCAKHGLGAYGNLIVGCPNEGLKEINETISFIKFAKKARAKRVYATILAPAPSTEIWELAKQKGYVNDYDMDWGKLTYYDKKHPLLLNENISPEQFQEKYQQIKKLVDGFTYRVMFKTVINSPIEALKTFIGDYKYHLGRLNYTFRKTS